MSRFEDFKSARWFWRLNRGVQILLALLFIAAINFIAAIEFERIDMTEGRRFALSPETLAYLNGLEEPVRIIVTEPQESARPEIKQIFSHLQRILKEYAYARRADGSPAVRVEYINVYRETDKAEKLVTEFGVSPESENAIIVASGDRYQEILGTELYEVSPMGENLFKGEEAFTSAILKVAKEEPLKLYFTAGHGEMQPSEVDALRGLSQLAGFLKQRNYKWEILDLLKIPEVPEDAGAVIVVGPQSALFPIEEQKLRDYLDQENGTVILLLEPGREHGLENLLYDWGVLSDDMLVLEASQDFVAAGGDMFVTRFAEHPITQLLIDSQQRLLFGLSRPVRADPGARVDDRTELTPLLGTSDMSWAERNYRSNSEQRFDEKEDLPGPVPLAVVSERSAASGMGLELPSGKLAVFGNAAFISNNRFNSAANKLLFFNLLNWAMDRDSLLSIPPRAIEDYQLTISQRELGILFTRLLWVPGVVALIGFLVFLFRRR